MNHLNHDAMYLARRFIRNAVHYVLRESVDQGGWWSHRDLLDLGATPQQYIQYPGGGAFFIDEQIIEALHRKGVSIDQIELEEFFLPFVDPHIRARSRMFMGRRQAGSWKPMDRELRRRAIEETHVFDRRRIYFLRLGITNMRRLDRSPTMFKILLDKSRDELEQIMVAQENELKPHEYRSYLFAIFDLQRFFSEPFARSMPQALDEERMDAAFIEQVCNLDRDHDFWQGFSRTDRLPPYLIRYVVMYFDYSFAPGRSFNEEMRSFFRGRRYARRKAGSSPVSVSEAATIFGVSRERLATMDRRAITSLYRKKAKELHPDKGGNHDQFIALTAAYNELLRQRP